MFTPSKYFQPVIMPLVPAAKTPLTLSYGWGRCSLTLAGCSAGSNSGRVGIGLALGFSLSWCLVGAKRGREGWSEEEGVWKPPKLWGLCALGPCWAPVGPGFGSPMDLCGEVNTS